MHLLGQPATTIHGGAPPCIPRQNASPVARFLLSYRNPCSSLSPLLPPSRRAVTSASRPIPPNTCGLAELRSVPPLLNPVMSDTPTPGLVRNVSLPVLAGPIPSSPHARRVPRVSSFSTLTKPSAHLHYSSHDDDQDLDADGTVPQVRHSPLPNCSSDMHYAAYFSEMHSDDDENDDYDDDSCHTDLHEQDHPPFTAPPTTIATSHPSSASSLVNAMRALLTAFVSPLVIFVPPPQMLRAPDSHLRFLFLSAITLLLLPPALFLSCILAHPHLLTTTLLIALVPPVARLSGSVTLATSILVTNILSYIITAAPLFSPVLLVWTSVVPVVTFATLGNRLGLASSAITAACVSALDFSQHITFSAPRIIIATWILFLGVTGVVQTHIARDPRMDHICGLKSYQSTKLARRKQRDVTDEPLFAELDIDLDESDAEVPEAYRASPRFR